MRRLKTYAHVSEVLSCVRLLLPKNPIVVEAGSFNGSDAIAMALEWPEGHIYSFEPVLELFKEVKEKTLPYKNITAHCKALSDKTGDFLFHLSEHIDNPGRRWGCGSLMSPKEHLTFDQFVYFPEEVVVQAVTLDHWSAQQGVEKVDFFWLDVQGSELNVLKESELAKKATAIFTEVEFVEAYTGQYLYNDLKEWMVRNGFRAIAADFDESEIPSFVKNRERYYGNVLFAKL